MRVVYEGPSLGVWIDEEGVYTVRGEHTDVSDDLAYRLAEQAAFTVVGAEGTGERPAYPYHVGGGYYETSDGRRIQGEDQAREHQDSLNQQQEE